MNFDIIHVWAFTSRGVPPMTGCAVLGPILPAGHLARPAADGVRRRDGQPCEACTHLAGCELDDCSYCGTLAAQRAHLAGEHATQRAELEAVAAQIRLVYAADLPPFSPTPTPSPEPVAAVPAPDPAGTGNPEPVQVHLTGRGLVDGYRFHLVDGVKPGATVKPVRKAVYGLRSWLRDTCTITVGGDGTRSFTIAPDTRDLTADRWAEVIDTVTGQLGKLLADRVPATGRHAETFPF